MSSLGERIRKLRKELKMSQSALAGNELKKGTISLIENGKVQPTARTLHFIAKQLGRSVSFFTEDPKYDLSIDELRTKIDLLMSNNNFEESIQVAQQALKMVLSGADRKTLSLMYIALGKAKYKLLRFEEALDSFEKAYEVNFQVGDFQISIESLFYCGNCHYKLGKFHLAKRDYKRVIDMSHSTKLGFEIYYRAQLYLGSTFYYLGDIPQSNQIHKRLYYERILQSYPLIKIDAGLGLAWTSHQLGNTPFAVSLSIQIRELSLLNNNYCLEHIDSNYGVFLCETGNSKAAFELWEETLASFESKNDRIAQAIVKEEIALESLRQGNIDLAESASLEALTLLDLIDDTVLSGRIYRILGTVAKILDNKQTALQWYRLAIQCFRTTKSNIEQNLTQELIDTLCPQSE